jgi:hypothetical protein
MTLFALDGMTDPGKPVKIKFVSGNRPIKAVLYFYEKRVNQALTGF